MNEPRVLEFRRRGKESASLMNDKRICDSSEASSIASGLGGSVPFDLPGAVENDERNKDSMAVLHRPNSAFSIRDISVSLCHSHTADIGIQCQLDGPASQLEKCLSTRRSMANSEHSRLLYSVHLPVMGSIIQSRSLPGTPIRKRRSHKRQAARIINDRTHSPTFSNLSECSRKLVRNKSGGDLPECSRPMLRSRFMSHDNSMMSHDHGVSFTIIWQ